MAQSNEGTVRDSVSSIADKAEQAARDVRSFGSQMRDVAGEKLDHLKDQAADYYQRGRHSARDAGDHVSDYVRDRPLQSLLIAAGVGLALGVLLRRR